jgi:hypothetical protein
VTKVHKVTTYQGVFKRSLSVMEIHAINGILNIGEENVYKRVAYYTFSKKHQTVNLICVQKIQVVFNIPKTPESRG